MIRNGCVEIENIGMYYASFGSGKRSLIMLPGLSDGLGTVKGKAFILAWPYKRFFKDFTVYMFSRKEKMPDGYTIEQMAEDQIKAMQMLGIDKACVLGVSQGGMIAQCMAIGHPEMIERLILAVTTPYANDTLRTVITNWIQLAKKKDHVTLMLDTADRMYSSKYLEQNRKWLPLVAKLTKPQSYERFMKNAEAILMFDVREKLSDIKCPTLILAGDNDKTVGNEAPNELKAGIENSELYVYEGLGHSAYEEADDFNERVYDFCMKSESV